MDVRRAEFDDCKDLSDLIAKNGGVSIFKATFGTYNLSSMIENSYLSLMSTYKRPTDSEVEERDTISFISVNDGLNLIANESDAYSKIIQAVGHYIPATVRHLLLSLRYKPETRYNCFFVHFTCYLSLAMYYLSISGYWMKIPSTTRAPASI